MLPPGKIRPLTEIVENLSDQIAEMERRLTEPESDPEGTGEVLQAYYDDPTPVLVEIAHDFGTFHPQATDQEVMAEIEIAVARYLNPQRFQ